MVMDSPSPQSVGGEFVRQYYTMLHEAPDYLHRFYSHNSSFLHGDEHLGQDQLPAVGQSEIYKKISALKFNDCHAKIRQVDSQWGTGGSVVIQVIGELSNNGLPLRRFMQTFVLAQQNPKKFYVHNDIFRYLDEVFTESGNDVEAGDESAEVEGVDGEMEVSPHVAGAQENAAVFYGGDAEPVEQGLQNIPVSNGNSVEDEQKEAPKSEAEVSDIQEALPTLEQPKSSDVVEATVEEEAIKEEPVVLQQTVVTEDGGLVRNEAEPAALAAAASAAAAAVSASEQEKPMPTEPDAKAPMPQKPTWAAMASKNTPVAASVGSGTVAAAATATAGYMTKPQATIRPEMKAAADANQAAQGLPQRGPRAPRAEGTIAQDGYRIAAAATETNEDAGRSSMQLYPDNQQVFVGNLPRNLADKELREFFEKFGGVLDMRINRKPNNNNLPNFGFVVFDSPETVQKVLSERPLMFNGKHRVNVEEKKPREELVAARPRSATHIAGKPGGAGRGTDSVAAGRGSGRPGAAAVAPAAAAPGGQRSYPKGAVNEDSKPSTR